MTWTPKDGPSVEEIDECAKDALSNWRKMVYRAARAAHDLYAEVERLKDQIGMQANITKSNEHSLRSEVERLTKDNADLAKQYVDATAYIGFVDKEVERLRAEINKLSIDATDDIEDLRAELAEARKVVVMKPAILPNPADEWAQYGYKDECDVPNKPEEKP